MLEKLKYNAYRARYHWGQHLPLRAPVDVSLELSSTCDLACHYCYHADSKNLPFVKGFMSKEMAFSILEESSSIGVNSLKFNFRGEGTLNPHYSEITAYAKSLAKDSIFIDRLANTNFNFFPKRRDAIFRGLANLTKVKVSFDSMEKDVLEKQRAKSNHERILENIDLFHNSKERQDSGTKLVIQAVRTKLNINEDFNKFKERWPDAEISIRDVVGGRVEKDVSDYVFKERDSTKRQSCKQAHVRIIFTHEGKALPCCPAIKEDLVIGDYKDQSVKEIFNGAKANWLRKSLKSGDAFKDIPACRDCSSFETFSGYKAPWGS